jgi:hypothetical protein
LFPTVDLLGQNLKAFFYRRLRLLLAGQPKSESLSVHGGSGNLPGHKELERIVEDLCAKLSWQGMV